MTKLVEFLVPTDEYSRGGFVEWRQGDHAERVRELPGSERYSTAAQADAAEYVDLDAGPRPVVEETVHVDGE